MNASATSRIVADLPVSGCPSRHTPCLFAIRSDSCTHFWVRLGRLRRVETEFRVLVNTEDERTRVS